MTALSGIDLDGVARTDIGGDAGVDLRGAVKRHGLAERRCDTKCSSGDRFTGRWRGVAVADILVDVDPTATHLLVESADGFRVCVDVRDAIDGILALERLDADPGTAMPRFVAPGISATRLVKDVARITTKRLDADEDPTEYDDLQLDDRD